MSILIKYAPTIHRTLAAVQEHFNPLVELSAGSGCFYVRIDTELWTFRSELKAAQFAAELIEGLR